MGVTPTTSKMPMINVIIEKRNTMLKLDFPAVLIGMISFVLLSCKKTKIADTKITNGNNEYNDFCSFCSFCSFHQNDENERGPDGLQNVPKTGAQNGSKSAPKSGPNSDPHLEAKSSKNI